MTMTEPVKVPVEEEGGPGRPSEYDPAFISKVDEYLKQSQDEWTEFHKTRGEKSDSYERVVKVKLPSREGFAQFIGKSVDALADWEKEHSEFGGALAKITIEQKDRLISEGLAGNYNPVIAKLLLSANHGMAEKTESKQEQSGTITIVTKVPDGSHNPL